MLKQVTYRPNIRTIRSGCFFLCLDDLKLSQALFSSIILFFIVALLTGIINLNYVYCIINYSNDRRNMIKLPVCSSWLMVHDQLIRYHLILPFHPSFISCVYIYTCVTLNSWYLLTIELLPIYTSCIHSYNNVSFTSYSRICILYVK